MAFFAGSDIKSENNGSDTSTTIITVGATIKGEINLTCNLYVDGEFDGTINSTNGINIGKNGHVNGEIVAKNISIQGKMDGTINAERVEIKAGGHMCGTIISKELVIEAKGIFEGDSKMKSEQTAKDDGEV
jgi:cytoskeletal protein CcmA (bactofilin family)